MCDSIFVVLKITQAEALEDTTISVVTPMFDAITLSKCLKITLAYLQEPCAIYCSFIEFIWFIKLNRETSLLLYKVEWISFLTFNHFAVHFERGSGCSNGIHITHIDSCTQHTNTHKMIGKLWKHQLYAHNSICWMWKQHRSISIDGERKRER